MTRALHRGADQRRDDESWRAAPATGSSRRPRAAQARKALLHQVGRISAHHQQLAVRHVDDAHQAVGDGQAQGHQQAAPSPGSGPRTAAARARPRRDGRRCRPRPSAWRTWRPGRFRRPASPAAAPAWRGRHCRTAPAAAALRWAASADDSLAPATSAVQLLERSLASALGGQRLFQQRRAWTHRRHRAAWPGPWRGCHGQGTTGPGPASADVDLATHAVVEHAALRRRPAAVAPSAMTTRLPRLDAHTAVLQRTQERPERGVARGQRLLQRRDAVVTLPRRDAAGQLGRQAPTPTTRSTPAGIPKEVV